MRPPPLLSSDPRPAPSRAGRSGGEPSPPAGTGAAGEAEAPTSPAAQAAHDRALVARLRRVGERTAAPASLRLRVAALFAAARRSAS